MFAFVVCPLGRHTRAAVFLHDTIEEIAWFDPDALLRIVRGLFDDGSELEEFEFFEIGRYCPITFEKQITYTLNQD